MAANNNNKMTWVTLRQQIARKTGMSEQDVARFLSSMTDAIVKALQQDGQVKINNLGQFRLQHVAPRKSVNVATGETIEIPQHNKISFIPEIKLKEELSGNSTPKLDPNIDPLKKLSEQADEICDLLADMGMGLNAPKDEPLVEEPQQEEAPAVVEPEVESEPVVEEPQQEEAPAVVEPEVESEPVVEEPKQEEQTQTEKKKKRPFRPWLTTLITILVFCVLLVVAYFFIQHKIVQWTESIREKVEQPTTSVEQEENSSPVEEDSVIVEDSVEVETLSVVDIDPFDPDAERDYSELITTEAMHEDSRLSWMAYRYYGSKDLWVLIYEANKDHIKNPSNVPVGTPIRVPKLSDEMRDVNNPRTKLLLDTLQSRFLNIH